MMSITTRVYWSEADEQMCRITWTWPASARIVPLTVSHSERLAIPKRPITRAAFERWIGKLQIEGCAIRSHQVNEDLRTFLERLRFSEVLTTVKARAGVIDVTVENTSAISLPLLHGRWMCEDERGSERCIIPLGAAASMGGLGLDRTLHPSGRSSIKIDLREEPSIRASVLSLAPNCFSLAICSWDVEVARIAGARIRGAISGSTK